EITIMLGHRAYTMLGFGGVVSATFARLFWRPRRLRVIATLVQMEQTGLDAMPIVGLLSFLIGVVMAYQGADQLRRFGAEIYTVNLLGIALLRFLEQLRGAITEWTLWIGVIKAPFFAWIIAMIGCYEGFNVTGSAESVGRLTTQSVVESIFIVIVADAAFSILFSLLKI